MAKKTATTILNTTARSAIVASYVNALTAHDSSGNIVTHVCDTVLKYNKGQELSAPDLVALADGIAKARGWKGDSLKSRVSEVKAVLKAYVRLPEAIKQFSTKAKRIHWHDSMKLARLLNKGESIGEAVAHAMLKGPGKVSTPSGRVAGALKSWAEAEPHKKADILKAAKILHIELKFKE